MAALSTKQMAARLAGLALLLTAGNAAAIQWNLPKGVTDISHEIYWLHMMALWVSVAIGVVVFGAMLYAIIRHRRSKGFKAAQFHESTTIEILWTIVPFLILVGMAIPTARTLIAMEDTSNSDMTIKITGYQWQWHYDYLDQGISFYSQMSTPWTQILNQADKDARYLREVDNEMVVPVGKKVRLLITASDVIHAWWVLDLGVKKDAIPGFINQEWFRINKPGVYRGQCTELCGRQHAYMPIVVRAVQPAQFDKWVKAQKSGGKAAQAAASLKSVSEAL
jgi:cytochrome c oxidase subunit 2